MLKQQQVEAAGTEVVLVFFPEQKDTTLMINQDMGIYDAPA